MGSANEGCPICLRMTRWVIGLLAILVPLLLGACAPPKARPPYVPAFNYAALTTTLQPGVSSAADVEAALGKPNGSGGYLFPVVPGPDTIWFYEKMRGELQGQDIDIKQDMILIFFKQGRFDGFLWFSDAHKNW